jgi:hypothetical protein
MAKPAVIFHPVIRAHVMFLASMASAPYAQIAIDSDATLSQNQKSGMMRREPPQRSLSGRQVDSDSREGNVRLGINAQGSQVTLPKVARVADDHSEKIVRAHRPMLASTKEGASEIQGESMAEVEDSTEFGTAAEEQEMLAHTQAQAIDANRISQLYRRSHQPKEGEIFRDAEGNTGPLFSEAALAEIAQESNASALEEEKKQDEELYYKLFPEERPGAAEAAALLESTTKSFRIKVPVSGGGKKQCLTEDAGDRHVRAEPCRRNEKRQKWYWSGSKLQNLHSTGRCLGVDQRKKPTDNTGQHHIQGHSLSMNFKCNLKHAPLTWALTETGQLQSVYNQHCMAINEMEDFRAMVLPCGFAYHQTK